MSDPVYNEKDVMEYVEQLGKAKSLIYKIVFAHKSGDADVLQGLIDQAERFLDGTDAMLDAEGCTEITFRGVPLHYHPNLGEDDLKIMHTKEGMPFLARDAEGGGDE